MQFLLEPTNPLNGVLYSEHGGLWKSTLTQPVTLGLTDRFSLDVQYPGLARSTFQLGCIRAPNLAGLLASTQPVDDLDEGDNDPVCLSDLLNDDLSAGIFDHLLPLVPPNGNENPRDLLEMLPFVKLLCVSQSWQTLLAPRALALKTRLINFFDRAGCGW